MEQHPGAIRSIELRNRSSNRAQQAAPESERSMTMPSAVGSPSPPTSGDRSASASDSESSTASMQVLDNAAPSDLGSPALQTTELEGSGPIEVDEPEYGEEPTDEEMDSPDSDTEMIAVDSHAAEPVTKTAQPRTPISAQAMYRGTRLSRTTLGSADEAMIRKIRMAALVQYVERYPRIEAICYALWDVICADHFRPFRRRSKEDQHVVVTTSPQVLLHWLIQEKSHPSPAVLANLENLDERERSMRVPDFGQVMLTCTVAEGYHAVLDASRRYPAIRDFIRATGHSLLADRCTLVIEIKYGFTGEGDQRRHESALYQLVEQCHHALAICPGATAIGGVLAFGKEFTYREVMRDMKVLDKMKNYPEGQAFEDPNEAKSERQKKEAKTKQFLLKGEDLGRALFRKFKQGDEFLDVDTVEGCDYLDMIDRRARQLAANGGY